MKNFDRVEIQQCVLWYEGKCVRRDKKTLPEDCCLKSVEWRPCCIEVEPFPTASLQMRGAEWVKETLQWVERQVRHITFSSFRIIVQDTETGSDPAATFTYCIDEHGLLLSTIHRPDTGQMQRRRSECSPRDIAEVEPVIVSIYTLMLQFSQRNVKDHDFRFYYESMAVIAIDRMRAPKKLNENDISAFIETVHHAARHCSSACTLVLKECATADGECRLYTLNPFLSASPSKHMICCSEGEHGGERQRGGQKK